MTRSDWTTVYAGYWDKIWGSKDPKPDEGEYYQRQLLHPFFRLDFAIGYDISDALTLVEQRSKSTPRDSFDAFLEERYRDNPIVESIYNSVSDQDEFSKAFTQFDQHYMYFVTLPPGEKQQSEFRDELCPRVVQLLDIAESNKFRERECGSFLKLVLLPFHAATLKVIRDGMDSDHVSASWTDFLDHAQKQLDTGVYIHRKASDTEVFVQFISELYAFLILSGHALGLGTALTCLNSFVRTRKNLGAIDWHKLSLNTRFKFAMAGLFAMVTLHPFGEKFDSSDVNTLYLMRSTLVDLNRDIANSGGLRYTSTIRYFLSRIDNALEAPASFHLVSHEYFSDHEHFAILGLVERFRLYRNPVTEDRIYRFLSQFGSRRAMKLALRLLQNVRFLTFDNLQEMLEDAFVQFDDWQQTTTFCPLGDASGSTGLMSYLASHWGLSNVKFEPDIRSALENTEASNPICLVDDGAFSGVQITNILHDMLGTRELQPHHTQYCEKLADPQRLRERSIRVCLALCCDKALANFSKQFPPMNFSDMKYRFSHLEVERSKPFEPSMAFIWDSQEDRREARDIFSKIGKQLLTGMGYTAERLEQSSLGFGNDQRLIVYQYNVPKSTVTALWKSGEVDGRIWEPLFPLIG
jgi:hypothetical protein